MIYKKIFEIGAGDGNNCLFPNFITEISEVYLFEPSKILFSYLSLKTNCIPQIKCINEAIYKDNFKTKFYNIGTSSYVEDIDSFLHTHIGQTINPDKVFIPLVTDIITKSIKEYDDGNIDCLLLDCEGCEYQVISDLISRPKLISLSCLNQSGHQLYKLNEIIQWLKNNNYQLINRNSYKMYFGMMDGE